MVVFAKRLEAGLNLPDSPMHLLKPRFTLMGSVPEGTRIGIANEMDVSVEFDGISSTPFKMTEVDPYHLYSNELFADWMSAYFDSGGRFLLGKFKMDLLNAVEAAAAPILEDKGTRLEAYTLNESYSEDDCESCKARVAGANSTSLFSQCKNCKVPVSQNKVGVCLQMAWRHEGFTYRTDLGDEIQKSFTIYTSLDLVPVYETEPIPLRSFVRSQNRGMVRAGHPLQWYDSVRKYLSHDKILLSFEDQTKGEMVSKVLLKLINCQTENCYMIKAGQHIIRGKFQSTRLKRVYCQIKVLRQALGVTQLSNYLLKKILGKPQYLRTELELSFFDGSEELLFRVLSSPHLKHYFTPYVDFVSYGNQKKKLRISLISNQNNPTEGARLQSYFSTYPKPYIHGYKEG